MDTGLKILDVMTVRPVVAAPHTTVRDVADLMDRYSVGSVLIKQGTQLLGIVTESDFVRRAVLEGHDPRATPISRIMTRDMVTVSPGMDVLEALELMKDSDVRHLPVVDDGKLVGFVTQKDILKIQPHLFDNVVESIRLREEDRKLIGPGPVIDEDE